MTYRLAVGQLVTAIEAIAYADTYQPDLFGRFTHDGTIGPTKLGTSRSFNILGPSGAKDGRKNGRLVDDVEIFFDYAEHNDRYQLDIAIHEDHDAVTTRLKNYGNLDVSNSTICVIFPADGDQSPYLIEDVEDDKGRTGRRLSIQIAIEHLAQTPN